MTLSQPQAARDGDDRFRLAMAASGIGMAIVDLDRCWVEVNPAFERMLGYRADEMIGRPAAAFTHPDDVERSKLAIDDLVAGRIEFIDVPKRYLRRDGEVLWAHANVAVMRDTAGAPLDLLVQVRDIGAEHAATAALRAHEAERASALEASQRQLQLFADAVAHDLRAPLRSIESFSALLRERASDGLDATARDYLGRIGRAAEKMSSLLAALGDLSYVTRTELKPAAVDVSLLAEWAAAELQDADPQRQVTVLVQPDLAGHGDERLLKQMLTRLLENAWNFTRDDPKARIEVTGEHDAQGLHLHVRDTGSGFDMRYAHKLFEPFQRLHGPDQGGGHGLGLAIAKRIVDRHGGQLRAESKPGSGTTFHVDLPAASAAER